MNTSAPAFTTELFTSMWNANAYVRAGNNRDTLFTLERERALAYPIIEANHSRALNLLQLSFAGDSDLRPVITKLIENGVLAQFSYAAYTKDFKSVDMGYFIAAEARTVTAKQFFTRIQEGLASTFEAYGATPFRQYYETRNPLSSSWVVVYGTAAVHQLNDLKAFVDIETIASLYERRADYTLNPESKNRKGDLFEAARRWSYREYRKMGSDIELFAPALTAQMDKLNQAFVKPLGQDIVDALTVAIVRFCDEKLTTEITEQFSQKQSYRSGCREQVKAAPHRYAAALSLIDAGATTKQLAEAQGISEGAARKVAQRAKAWRNEIEANSGVLTTPPPPTPRVQKPARAQHHAPAPRPIDHAPVVSQIEVLPPAPTAAFERYGAAPVYSAPQPRGENANRLHSGADGDAELFAANVIDNTAEMLALQAKNGWSDEMTTPEHPTVIQGWAG